jgi:hypothetical protein
MRRENHQHNFFSGRYIGKKNMISNSAFLKERKEKKKCRVVQPSSLLFCRGHASFSTVSIGSAGASFKISNDIFPTPLQKQKIKKKQQHVLAMLLLSAG